MWLYGAQLVLEDDIKSGAVHIDASSGVITSVLFGDFETSPDGSPGIHCENGYLSPGFCDIQFNGALGVDFSSPSVSEADVDRLQLWLPSTGVTSFLPTLISSSPSTYRTVIPIFRKLHGKKTPDGRARILGLHLEGPFMSPSKKGAHCEGHLASPGGLEQLLSHYSLTPCDIAAKLLRVVTLAPELEGSLQTIHELASSGVLPSLGHTATNFAGAVKGLDNGALLITHLFNAMNPLTHREPGMVGLLGLANPPFFSLIADGGVHLHPAVLALAFKAAPHRAILVTDAMTATGLPAGSYSYGDLAVTVFTDEAHGAYPSRHVVLTGGTTLAGSVATMDMCLATLAKAVCVGESAVNVTQRKSCHPFLHQIFSTVTQNPLEALRAISKGDGCDLRTLGAIGVGKAADLTLISRDWKVMKTWVAGKMAYPL